MVVVSLQEESLLFKKNSTIFILAASFHKKEDGYEHQEPIKIINQTT